MAALLDDVVRVHVDEFRRILSSLLKEIPSAARSDIPARMDVFSESSIKRSAEVEFTIDELMSMKNSFAACALLRREKSQVMESGVD